jgi:TolB protein
MRLATFKSILPLALLIAALPGLARAQVTVDVVGGESNRVPVAILAFGGDEQTAEEHQMARVISDDFSRSSALKVVEDRATSSPPGDEAIDYAYFKARGVDMVVAGTLNKDNNAYEVHFVLFDVAREKRILDGTLTHAGRGHRRLAHRIADLVHEKIAAYPGAYATRICYITRSGDSSELVIADADGYNRAVLFQSPAPLMSVQWSPDGTQLAYVSFERKRPRVYVHNLADGSRKVIANFRGTNSSPAWSPDGKQLAVTLSKDGGSQIYMMDANGKNLRRLSDSRSRDTEPSFSPDGRQILFSSDRGGSPQIYRIPVDDNGRAERLTFEGGYNTSPRYSPDGRSFAFVHQQGGHYGIGIKDLSTGEFRYLTSGRDDRSPAFAPNGKAILYATELMGHGALAAVSTDGATRWAIAPYAHNVRSPAWGPYESRQLEVK